MDSRNPGALSQQLLDENRFQALPLNVNQHAGKDERQAQVGLSWRREVADGGWEMTAFGISRNVVNPTGFNIIDLDRNAGGLRTIFRSAPLLGDLGLRLSVGADADLQRDDRQNWQNQQGERGNLNLDQFERVTNAAGFLQATAEPTPGLTLLGGLRYDWFRFSVDDRFITSTNPDDSGSRVMDALSPSIGLTYSFGDWLNLYGNVASSFETPTTTELANRPTGAGGFNPELDPQSAISYEIGTKGALARTATYQLSVYHADVRNELIPFEVPQAPTRQFFQNAGSTTRRGLEGALAFVPLRRTLLRGASTYTDARFDDFTVRGQSFDGNRLPGVSPHRLDVTVSYGTPGGHFAALEGRYASRTTANDLNDTFAPSYFVVDGRVALGGVRFRRLGVEPFAGMTNMFDTRYITALAVNATQGRFFEPGPGRSLFIGMSARVGS
jgi:iron complex outermembrane recepter protein